MSRSQRCLSGTTLVVCLCISPIGYRDTHDGSGDALSAWTEKFWLAFPFEPCRHDHGPIVVLLHPSRGSVPHSARAITTVARPRMTIMTSILRPMDGDRYSGARSGVRHPPATGSSPRLTNYRRAVGTTRSRPPGYRTPCPAESHLSRSPSNHLEPGGPRSDARDSRRAGQRRVRCSDRA